MKNIVVISPSKFPGTTGDTANYSEIVNQLAKDGFKVFLICPKNPDTKNQTLSLSKDVKIIRIPFLPPRLNEIENKAKTIDYFRLLIFLFIELLTVWSLVTRKRIRYGIIRHDILTIQLPFFLKLFRIRTLADGKLLDKILKDKTKKTFYKLIQKYEKSAINCYNFFKVTSDGQLINDLKKIGYPKSKILIIPIGINLDNIPKYSIEQIPKHTFGYFGVLEEWQGLDILINGFQLLQKKIPNAKLYILGEGSLKSQLKKKVVENNLSSNVIFNSVTRDVLFNEYFKKFRIVIIPRPKQKDSKDEIIPIKLIESLAAAKSIIVMDIPIMRKFPKNAIYIVESSDAETLANAMEEFSYNENKMNQFSKNAYEVSKNYDIRIMVKKIENSLFYERKE